MKKPKNYYCHKSHLSQPFSSISQNIEIVQKIGEGAFGQVYKVFDHMSSQIKVIKKHKRQSSEIFINKENQIMKQMSGSQGFAKIKQIKINNNNNNNNGDYCKTNRTSITNDTDRTNNNINNKKNNMNIDDNNNINMNTTQIQLNFIKDNQQIKNQQLIVMQCLGDSLGKIIDNNKSISIYTMKRIAIQLITRLKQLHEKFYVHRDLKPQNILLGNQSNPHKIYLVDFGLVTSFRRNPIKSIRKIYDGIIGTAKFCSIASHLGYQQFPKDDLQSLGYVLLYMINKQLPWKISKEQNIINDQQKFNKMGKIKQQIKIDQLVKGINCMKKYFSYIKILNVNDKIDYQKLIQIFKIQDKNIDSYCYQFCKTNCFEKIKKNYHQIKQINTKQLSYQVQDDDMNGIIVNFNNNVNNINNINNKKEQDRLNISKYSIESKFKKK